MNEACRASGTRIIAFGHGALRAPWILVSHYARSSLRGRARDSVCRGFALDRLLVDHASGLHFELLLDPRSGPVGVGSSKGVAISDDGSSKGLFTLF